MGFGAVIASGDKNAFLPDALVNCIAEVRVEQTLDDPTRFAIRFQDDICDGRFEAMDAPELQCGRMITIAVKVGGDLRCLVRGPITDATSSFVLGGPGTTHQIQGEDRRIELDRQITRHGWTGRASDIAETILSPKFKTSIQKTTVVYGARRSQGREVLETLNQPSSDAWFIAAVARANNFHFWLQYDNCRAVGEALTVDETANLKSSPPRPDDGAPPPSQAPVQLVPTTSLTLRVNVPVDQCPNVTAFSLRMDAERPNRFSGLAINDREVKPRSTRVNDPQPPIQKDGQRFAGTDAPRDVAVVTAGDERELQVRAEAALTAAGWFLNATASTTAQLLNGILLPHDVVAVEGVGGTHDGPYQVRAVTHVINPADHFMDIQLRRNAVGKT
jgi:hypothetical protein